MLVTTPGGEKTTYSYNENETTVTDPANVKKKLVTDSLGRLVSVTEDPGGLSLETKYFYNALGDLLTVCPSGGSLSEAGVCTGTAQARTFSYDWLGRLLTAANPESSTVSYTYDETASTNGAGQLTSKSQSRGVGSAVTATVRYHDNLGRMTSKVYTGTPDGITTPTVTHSYDVHSPPVPQGVTSYPKGRRTRTEVAGGTVSTIDSFDAMGRATRSRQGTYRFGSDGIAGYEYLRNGAVSVMRLPTGRTLSYTYDDAGRPTGVGDGGTAYVSTVGYTDFGAIGTLRMNGQLLRETRSYDTTRLQLTGIALERCADGTCAAPTAVRSFGYTYATGTGNGGGPNNNGSIRTQVITDPGTSAHTQIYGYDVLDRLISFTEGALSRTYCYDAHGNRAVQSSSGLSPLIPQVSPCTASAVAALFPANRWAMTPYDAAGGIGNDGRSNLRYDAEDRLVKTWPSSGGAETLYSYDGDGNRVTAGAVTFVYDVFGKLAVEYGAPVTASGREFVGVDHLGSSRAAVTETSVRRMDYWPFGMEMGVGDTSWRTPALGFAVDATLLRLKFTGKERHEETGLDNFGARFYSGAMGRFASTDPKGHSMRTIANPQKWNKYSYVLNNPLALVDPDGLEEVTITYRTFIPTASVTVLGKTNGGDNRGFSTAANASHRTSISVRLETDPRIRPGNPIISVVPHAGPSTTIENGRVVGTKTATVGLPTATGTRDANGTPIINIQQNTKNPEAPVAQALTPGITANLNVMVYQDVSVTQVSGTAAQFPASELNLTRADGTTTAVIQYMPPTGATPWSLIRPDRDVNETKHTPCKSGDPGCTQ